MGWVIFVCLQQHLSQVQLKVIGVAAMATPMSGGTVPLEPGEDHMDFCRGKGILQKEWHGAFFEPRDFKFHERLCPCCTLQCRACATWAREQLRRVYPTIVEVKAPPGEPPSHLAADLHGKVASV